MCVIAFLVNVAYVVALSYITCVNIIHLLIILRICKIVAVSLLYVSMNFTYKYSNVS